MLPGRDGAISPGTRRLSPLPVGEIACTQTLLGPELADNAEQTVSPCGPDLEGRNRVPQAHARAFRQDPTVVSSCLRVFVDGRALLVPHNPSDSARR